MIGCYVRVSTQEQANEGYSITEQAERLEKYADAMGWKVFKVYTDGGFSGANINRPALQQMINDVKMGLINRIVVYKLDRLSRSQKDTLYLIEDVFLANGCDFVSMSENFDTSTPFGRAMIGILAVFSQLEREQIKERMMMGKDARIKEGKYHGYVKPPVGYDYENGMLVVNEFEAVQIQEVFDMYLKGMSPRKIADNLNARGLYHKYGKWDRNVIKRALVRPTYIGLVEYKNEIYDGQHEAIISRETFEAVQRRIHEIQKPFTEVMNGHNYNSYLSGLLVCARCGATFVKTMHSANTKDGKPYHYYICNSKLKKRKEAIKDPNCKNKTWRMVELDSIIFDEVKKLTLDEDYLKSLKNKKRKDNRPEILDKKIADLDLRLNKLIELYSLDGISFVDLQKKIDELNTMKMKVSEEKMKVLAEHENDTSKADAVKYLKGFHDVLERGSMEEIRATLQALIEKIEIDGDDVTIFWKFT